MKSILITGASRGIGRATAVKAAATGLYDRIIINCRQDSAMLEQTAKQMKAAWGMNASNSADQSTSSESNGAQIISSVGDLADISYVEKLHEEVGEIDVIINNAAISKVGLFIDMTPEEWREILDTNLTSIYNVCHTFIPDMIKEHDGIIVNVSSVWGISGASCEVAYSTVKGAVNTFTKALAKELAPSNIRVNAIAPGIVDTEMNAHLSKEELAGVCDEVPMGRMAAPDEIAEAIMKIVEMPAYMTGEVIKMDGGWQ